MEVILKKTKITSTMLKQAQTASLSDLENGQILGWCIFNKYKYIVCYRLNMVYKYLLIDDVVIKNNYDSHADKTIYCVNVTFYDHRFSSVGYNCQDEKESELVISVLKNAKHKAKINGQFFI